MRRPRQFLGLLMLISVAAVGFVVHESFLFAQAKRRPVFTVEDLQSGTVIGRLGIELGHVCVVEGTIVASTSRAKSSEGKPVLQVHRIDGKSPAAPVAFADDWAGHERFKKEKLRPDDLIGRAVKWAVYETGEFSGLPTGDIYSPTVAWHGFGFSSRLVVVHDFADGFPQRAGNSPSPLINPK